VRLPFKLPFRLPFAKREREERAGGAEERRQKPGMPVVARGVERVAVRITERFRTRPGVVFIGSGKGGSGKSFVASNLAYIAAVHLPEDVPVYAVDLDLDNGTLSMVLPPPEIEAKLRAKLASANVDYLNVADILDEGVVGGKLIFSFPFKVFACGGTQMEGRLRLIPPYHELRKKSQMIKLRELDALRLREGLNSLIDYLRERKGVAILDGKQKSDLGINYDPLYRVAKERADAVLIVTEPPYLSFSDITAQYTDIMDKLVIVVNKIDAAYADKLMVLVSDAARHEVPVFVVPLSKLDAELYSRKLTPPAENLSSKTARFVGAIAMYMKLVERCDTRCCEYYEAVLSKTLEMMEKARGL